MKIITLLLIIPAAIWGGYVLSILWGWFFVPVFGLPTLSVPQAIGISLIVGFLTYHYQYEEDDEEVLLKRIVGIFLVPLECLIIGWIVHLFI